MTVFKKAYDADPVKPMTFWSANPGSGTENISGCSGTIISMPERRRVYAKRNPLQPQDISTPQTHQRLTPRPQETMLSHTLTHRSS